MKYLGITHFVPYFLERFDIIYWLWRKTMCPRHIHLLDECESLDEHYLVCDACQLMVNIEGFDCQYVDTKLLQTWKRRKERCF